MPMHAWTRTAGAVLIVVPLCLALGGVAVAAEKQDVEIFWTFQSPGGDRDESPNLEDVVVLPDGSVALTVSERPNEFYFYRLDPEARLQQRVYLGESSNNTYVDRAIAAVLPPLAVLNDDAFHNSRDRALPVIVASSQGQVWRMSPEGQVEWFVGTGIWVTTSMRPMADGSVLLGGRGETDYGASCGFPATVVRLDRDGNRLWRWRFELPFKWTYANQFLVMNDDTIVVRIETDGPGIEMGSTSNPCSDFSSKQWIAWLAPDGTPLRIIKVPYELIIDLMALIPINRILAVGRERATGRLFLRITSPDGEHVHLHRVYDFRRDAGWNAVLQFREVRGLHLTKDKLFIFADFECDDDEACPGEGLRAITVAYDGHLIAASTMSAGLAQAVSVLADGTGYLQLYGDRLLRVPFE